MHLRYHCCRTSSCSRSLRCYSCWRSVRSKWYTRPGHSMIIRAGRPAWAFSLGIQEAASPFASLLAVACVSLSDSLVRPSLRPDEHGERSSTPVLDWDERPHLGWRRVRLPHGPRVRPCTWHAARGWPLQPSHPSVLVRRWLARAYIRFRGQGCRAPQPPGRSYGRCREWSHRRRRHRQPPCAVRLGKRLLVRVERRQAGRRSSRVLEPARASDWSASRSYHPLGQWQQSRTSAHARRCVRARDTTR